MVIQRTLIGLAVLGTLGVANVALATGPLPGLNVKVVNSPLPVTVVNPPPPPPSSVDIGNPQDIAAAIGAQQSPTMRRFIFAAGGGLQTISPPVPAGQHFVATYVSLTMESGNSAFPLTNAACRLFFFAGGDSDYTPFRNLTGSINTTLSDIWSASEQMLVPLNAGDSIRAQCAFAGSVAASTQVQGILSGYFQPAP